MGRFNSDDTSNVRIDKFDKQPLHFDDRVLAYITRKHSDAEIVHVPGLRYWDMDEDRKMDRPDNKCGFQQRAFEFYWAIRDGWQEGLVVLGVGTGSVSAPSELTTDLFNGTSPDAVRYPNPNGYSHLQADAQDLSQFFDGKFGAVIANHCIEHLDDTERAVREWLRVTREYGHVCIVQPDMTYSKRGSIDPTHISEECADGFFRKLQMWQKSMPFEIVSHNTLDNAFSFETVLRRTS